MSEEVQVTAKLRVECSKCDNVRTFEGTNALDVLGKIADEDWSIIEDLCPVCWNRYWSKKTVNGPDHIGPYVPEEDEDDSR